MLVVPYGDAPIPQVVNAFVFVFKCTALQSFHTPAPREAALLFYPWSFHLLPSYRFLPGKSWCSNDSQLSPYTSYTFPQIITGFPGPSIPARYIRCSGLYRSKMTFRYEDGIALLQLIAFVPSLFLAIILCYQQGMKAVASCWRFLIILACLRISGAVCQLITITDASINVITTKIKLKPRSLRVHPRNSSQLPPKFQSRAHTPCPILNKTILAPRVPLHLKMPKKRTR